MAKSQLFSEHVTLQWLTLVSFNDIRAIMKIMEPNLQHVRFHSRPVCFSLSPAYSVDPPPQGNTILTTFMLGTRSENIQAECQCLLHADVYSRVLKRLAVAVAT